MEFSENVVAALTIAAVACALVALALAMLSIAGQRHVKRSYRVFSGGRREDVLSLLQRHVDEVEGLRADVAALRDQGDHLRELLAGAVTRVSTIRYDAFDDMGGHMSYSTALLDERGNGVVFTSIHGRTDTRTYAKPVEGGSSPHTLSGEEADVIAAALDRQLGRQRRTRDATVS